MNFIEKFFVVRAIKSYIRKVKKMAEKEKKPWYLSKGVIGSAVTMAIGLAGAFGMDGLEVEKDTIIELILSIATAAAGALALYGRVKAKKELTK